jgi:hypothetical protein
VEKRVSSTGELYWTEIIPRIKAKWKSLFIVQNAVKIPRLLRCPGSRRFTCRECHQTGKRNRLMKLQDIEKSIVEFKKKHRDAYAKEIREEIKGEVKFIELTMRFKVDSEKKLLISANKSV